LFNAQLSIIDTNGCASPPNAVSSTVFTNPTINYTGPTSVCGPLINLLANATPDAQDPIDQIVWQQNSQTIGTGNPFAFDLQSNNGSIETFTVAVTSNLGCTGSDTFQVSFNPYPSVAFDVNPLCDGQTVNLTNQSTWTGTPINGTSIQAIFQPGDGQTLNNIPSSYTYNQSGTYTASLILESSAGCSDTSTQTFQLLAVPQITLSSQDTCGQVVTFQALFNVQATAVQNFDWTINTNSYNQNPLTLTFDQTGNIPYTFTLNLNNGCTYNNSGSIDIIPSVTLPSLIFPNIISTQSNSENHRWEIDTLYENCASFELKILNRWGQTIFTTNSSQKAFEGKHDNGEILPEGIYFYLFTSGEEKRQGFIHVVQ
jgi:gliding motility-associated-like protein